MRGVLGRGTRWSGEWRRHGRWGHRDGRTRGSPQRGHKSTRAAWCRSVRLAWRAGPWLTSCSAGSCLLSDAGSSRSSYPNSWRSLSFVSSKRAAVAFEWSPLTFARSWYEMQLEAPARADIVLKMHSRVMAAIWVCFSRADIFERCLLL